MAKHNQNLTPSLIVTSSGTEHEPLTNNTCYNYMNKVL